MNKALKPAEVEDLMKALGFHHLDSRARWKLKVCDTIMVTDADLKYENEAESLAEYLIKHLDEAIASKDKLIRKKKILLAFFKS